MTFPPSLITDRFCFRSLLKGRRNRIVTFLSSQHKIFLLTPPLFFSLSLTQKIRRGQGAFPLGAFTQTSSPWHHHPDTLRGEEEEREKHIQTVRQCKKERERLGRQGRYHRRDYNSKQERAARIIILCPVHDFFSLSSSLPWIFYLSLILALFHSFPLLSYVSNGLSETTSQRTQSYVWGSGEKVNYVWGKKWKVKKRETCTDRTPDISNKLVKDEWKEKRDRRVRKWRREEKDW